MFVPDKPERLLAEVWVQRLAWIEERLRQGCEIEPLLRHAFHLAQLTPLRWSELVGDVADEIEFEGALGHEDGNHAARLLLGDAIKIVRLTPTSGCMAVSVRCARFSGSAIGVSVERAALGAWIVRILDAVGHDEPFADHR